MLAHQASLNKFKKTEIISNIFSKHNGVKLETNNRRKPKKHKHMEAKKYITK